MTTITEFHTTHLSESCPRATLLTIQGKRVPEMTSALYQGQLAHAVIEELHRAGDFSEQAITAKMVFAAVKVEKEAAEEGRPFSDAVKANKPTLNAEVLEWVVQYAEQLAPKVTGLVGVEVPIRFTLEHEDLDEPAEFASHLDLVFHDGNGPIVWDWKSASDAPSYEYLRRNKQLAFYWLAFRHGEILHPDLGWVNMGQYPLVGWVHLRNLMPFKRASTDIDHATGEEIKYQKGDRRPFNRVVRYIDFANERAIRDELALYVRMSRAGMFPTNPDPVGCTICECRTHCASFNGGGK